MNRSSFKLISSFSKRWFTVKSDGRLKGKVGIVTGGSSGIGKETSLLFAQEGAKVAVVDINDTQGKETVKMIKDLGGEAIYIHADQAKEKEVENMVATTEKQFGKVNIVFNNAGISHADDNGIDTDEKIWDLTFAINVKGVFFGCKYGIPALKYLNVYLYFSKFFQDVLEEVQLSIQLHL